MEIVAKIVISISILTLFLHQCLLINAIKPIKEQLSWVEINKKLLNTTVEGCMLFPRQNNNTIQNKYIPKGSSLFWPNKRVPYQLSPAFKSSEIKTFDDAIKWWNQNTCIRWVKRNSIDKDYVNVTKAPGCLSYVGKVGGAQLMSLESACFNYVGTVIHEMMHAIGFIHEQSRPDRDAYVKINVGNILPGRQHNFNIENARYFDKSYGFSYDINSVMHYPVWAFSNGRGNTIESKTKQELGCLYTSKTCPTALDAKKIKAVYRC